MAYAQSPASWITMVAVLALSSGCGSKPPPPRGVLEADVSTWSFRRYQQLLDVEIWIANNKAVAHAASYVRSEAEKAGRIDDGDVVNAVVTRYEVDEGVRRGLVHFARRLASESGYRVEEERRGGVRLITVNAHEEAWVLWAAERHIVKIGGRGVRSVPAQLIEAYGALYPSRLESGMLDGALPDGPGAGEPAREDEPYDPANPRPEWDRYQPGEVKKPGNPNR